MINLKDIPNFQNFPFLLIKKVQFSFQLANNTKLKFLKFMQKKGKLIFIDVHSDLIIYNTKNQQFQLFKLSELEIINIEAIYLCEDHKLLLIKSKNQFSVLDLQQRNINNLVLYQTKIKDICYKIEKINNLKFMLLMNNQKITILELNIINFKSLFKGFVKKSQFFQIINQI